MEIFVVGRFNEFGGGNVEATTDKAKAINLASDLVEEMNEEYDDCQLEQTDTDNPNIYKLWSFGGGGEEGVFIEKYDE
jgi:hypothetical protein